MPEKRIRKESAPRKKSRKKLEAMLMTPCKTREQFSNWVKYFLGLHLPDHVVSRYADTTPLDVAWEVYRICVLRDNPEDIQELLYVASRGSGKTLGMAIAELMVILHDRRDTVHVGAILGQAKRCYEYIVKFLLNQKLSSVLNPSSLKQDKRIMQKMNMEKSVFKLGGEQVTLEILPCTLKSVNGPHCPLVVLDELDTISGEGIRAFDDITGMLDSRGAQKALRVGISTRKTLYGLMNSQMENAIQENRTIRRWTAFEFTERCPDSKSGTEPLDLYIRQEALEALPKEQYDLKDPQRQKEYEKHTLYTGCQECPLAAICLGDAKKQKSTSFMLKTLKELEQKVLTNGADWSLSQLMNLKPSMEGIIYKEFDRRDHVKTWNEMWKKLTGKDFPGECTHDMFVKKCHELGLPCYAGIDWGWSNPSTVVFFFIDTRENIYVVRCDGETFCNDPKWIEKIKTKYHRMYRCQLYFPDIANGSAIDLMKQGGLPVANKIDKSINLGIQVIKRLLRTPGSGEPKILFAHETCSQIIDEMERYHFKINTAGEVTDDPEKEFDHWLDAIRYALTMLLGKAMMLTMASGDVYDSNITDKHGSFYNVPTAAEFAAAHGIQFTENLAEQEKIGKVGTLSELDDDDGEDGGTGGDGGFLWSF